MDLTEKKIFVIDPENCTDADDAFSIEFDNSDVILWLFIADPTKELDYSEFIKCGYVQKATTKYFLDKSPNHLFSDKIVEKYSLDKGIKPAIGIKVIFNKNFDIKSKEIHFVKIKINNHYSYNNVKICNILLKGLEISKALFKNRCGTGKILNDFIVALPKYNTQSLKWELYAPDNKTKKLQNMIAEFAILANQIIAENLENKFKLNTTPMLNRICDSGIETENPRLFLENIIKNETKAKYTTENKNHEMIDNKIYTHFTSPLRRASDCLVHYILRNENIEIDELANSCNIINEIARQDKKRQYNEIKKYTLIAMNEMHKPILVKFRVISHNGIFLNMIMTNINNFNVQISISIRTKITLDSKDLQLEINNINLMEKYDNQIIPELNQLIT
jgi:ribonuclease R